MVNRKINVPVEQREELKAIINNCVIKGPSTQIETYWRKYGYPKSCEKSVRKLKERLWGRIKYVKSINPQTGQKLIHNFNKIDWN